MSNISYEAGIFKCISDNAVLFPLILLNRSIISVLTIWKSLSLVLLLRIYFLSGIFLICSYLRGPVSVLITDLFPRIKLKWDDTKFMLCQKHQCSDKKGKNVEKHPSDRNTLFQHKSHSFLYSGGSFCESFAHWLKIFSYWKWAVSFYGYFEHFLISWISLNKVWVKKSHASQSRHYAWRINK